MNNKIELSTIEVGDETNSTKSIIWLHGLGADANDFVPIVPELKLPKSQKVRFIFPNAPIMPVTINNGYKMRAWFDIYGIGHDSKIDNEGIANSVTAVSELIEKEIARGVEAKNILLSGFSQGAVIALTCAISFPKKLAGIIALSGYFPSSQAVFKKAIIPSNELPIFMGHGTQDNIVPLMLGLASYNLLKEAGYSVDWHTYPMAHSVCAEEIIDISEWLQSTAFK